MSRVIPMNRVFPDTRWSVVMMAAHEGHAEAQGALATLFRAYWYPLFAHLRARGHTRHEAEDLLQAFFVHVLERQAMARADRLKGSFRGFLLGCLKFFLANERERAQAQKRGGQVRLVSFDTEVAEARLLADSALESTDAERDFDRRWAVILMENALSELESAHAQEAETFAALKGFLTAGDETPYPQVAERLGVSVAFVKTRVHRLRGEFREILRREIAVTVTAPHEVDEELRHLLSVLTEG